MGQRAKPRRRGEATKRLAKRLRTKCAAPDGGKRFDRVGHSRALIRCAEIADPWPILERAGVVQHVAQRL